MELGDYLENADSIQTDIPEAEHAACRLSAFIEQVTTYKIEVIKKFDLVIIGVTEDRNTYNKGCASAPNHIRKELYQLFAPGKKVKIADLGNIRNGQTVNDTYAALREVLTYLFVHKIVCIVIGGSQDLSYPVYQAFEKNNKPVSITSIDSRLDLGNAEQSFHSQSYLSKIILQKSKHLFSFSTIGYQTYLVPDYEIELMDKLYFDVVRLGIVQTDLKDCEPIIRNSDFVTLDISAVRQGDAPGCKFASPNGLYGEEACQLSFFAGFADKVNCFGIFEVNPKYDRDRQTTQLAAQIIWHFIYGFYQRKMEYDFHSVTGFTKFIVKLNDHSDELVFFKSLQTDRWWMEVPNPNHSKKSTIIPCSYADYQRAAKQEIPDRWWRFFQKLL